jgi:hypothetical protein
MGQDLRVSTRLFCDDAVVGRLVFGFDPALFALGAAQNCLYATGCADRFFDRAALVDAAASMEVRVYQAYALMASELFAALCGCYGAAGTLHSASSHARLFDGSAGVLLAVFPEDLHKLAADASVVAVLDVVV